MAPAIRFFITTPRKFVSEIKIGRWMDLVTDVGSKDLTRYNIM